MKVIDEFAANDPDWCSLAIRALSGMFLSRQDVAFTFGSHFNRAEKMDGMQRVKPHFPVAPVLANEGVKYEAISRGLATADGWVGGSSLKVDGRIWDVFDPACIGSFTSKV
ncbi:MAG: BtpA/SgcQ family protein [Paracoccaceae bacterium]